MTPEEIEEQLDREIEQTYYLIEEIFVLSGDRSDICDRETQLVAKLQQTLNLIVELIEQSGRLWRPNSTSKELYKKAIERTKYWLRENFWKLSKDIFSEVDKTVELIDQQFQKVWLSTLADVELEELVRKAQECLQKLDSPRGKIFEKLGEKKKLSELTSFLMKSGKRKDLSDETKDWIQESSSHLRSYQKLFSQIMAKLDALGKIRGGGVNRYKRLPEAQRNNTEIAQNWEIQFEAYHETCLWVFENLERFDPGKSTFAAWFNMKLKYASKEIERNRKKRDFREEKIDSQTLLSDSEETELVSLLDKSYFKASGKYFDSFDDLLFLEFIELLQSCVSQDKSLRNRRLLQKYSYSLQALILRFLETLKTSDASTDDEVLEEVAIQLEVPLKELKAIWRNRCKPELERIAKELPLATPHNALVANKERIRQWAQSNPKLKELGIENSSNPDHHAQSFILEFLEKLKHPYNYERIRSQLAKKFGLPEGRSRSPKGSVDDFWQNHCSPLIRQFLQDEKLL